MKRFIAAISLAVLASLSFASCQMARDTVDAAEEAVTDASDNISDIADGKNNGAVTDEDGIISDGDDDNGEVKNNNSSDE
ncbi:MAG: hypothetical protein VZR54_06470 [Ruminococcus sp.]|jgi:predicted small secreted protein|nr:hypothetical protein [Ruminococcus sp.]